ncbi:MAG: class I SAM-dependent methyltransferase [Chitinophagales bacterium]|nr:class I SAM-dependent methyltransferase [Bacteroidota bacterium]
MGVKLPRKKHSIIWLSLIYRLQKYIPISHKLKLKIFLNLEWLFDRLAHEMSFKSYAPLEHPMRLKSKQFILDNVTSESKVLDLGCNLGDISFIIAEKAKEVIGIDYNPRSINIANKRYQKENLKFYNIEAYEYLTQNKEQFDILILSHILEHLDNPKDFLIRFKDFFKEIYIEVPDFERYYLNLYRQNLGMHLLYSDDDHITEFDRDELRALLSSCNIEILKSEYRYGVQKLWCKVSK